MNSCNNEKYLEVLEDEVIKFCEPISCNLCLDLIIDNLNPLKRELTKTHPRCQRLFNCINSLPCGIKSNSEKASDYLYSLFGYGIPDSDYSFNFFDCNMNEYFNYYKFMYINVSVTKIKEYLEILSLINYIRFPPFGEEKRLIWIYGFSKIYENNPNINYEDIKVIFIDLIYNKLSSNYSIFEKKIKELNDSRISTLWELWELESEEYSEYIQWLPEELIVDISQLEKKQGGRFSHSAIV